MTEEKSNEQIQFESGKCFECGYWNGYDVCCDRKDNAECPFSMNQKQPIAIKIMKENSLKDIEETAKQLKEKYKEVFEALK